MRRPLEGDPACAELRRWSCDRIRNGSGSDQAALTVARNFSTSRRSRWLSPHSAWADASITDVNGGARQPAAASAEVLSSARSLSHESQQLKIEMDKFLNMVRTERADRRQHDDPSFTGPERRAERRARAAVAS